MLIGAHKCSVPTRQPRADVPMMLLMAGDFAVNVAVQHLPLRSAVSATTKAFATVLPLPPAVPQACTAAMEPAVSVALIAIVITATPAVAVTPVFAEVESPARETLRVSAGRAVPMRTSAPTAPPK